MRLNLLLGILAFFLLCFSCISRHLPRIEHDLRSRSAEALESAGIPIRDISFSGRDATLAGSIASEELSRRAEELVSSVYGVRMVDNRLAVTRATPVSEGSAALQLNLDHLVAEKVIGFSAGSDVIVEEGRALLDALVPILSQNNTHAIEIAGHTDSSGNPSANQDLSQRRADAVKRYLVSRGVNSALLTAVGYGSSRPVADNATAEGRQANRRIVFRVNEEK